MDTKANDKDRAEEVRRKKILWGAAVLVVLVTLAVSSGLSRLAVGNVEVEEGISMLREMEKSDPAPIEQKIRKLEQDETAPDTDGE